MRRTVPFVLAASLLVVPLAAMAADAPTAAATAGAVDDGLARLLRQPDIEGNTIVFVYGGDIWSVEASGGTARRLTSHPGMEQFPKLSPDGKWIAFTGDYSGTRQVHVMPVAGGAPKQLTWYNDVGDLPPRGGIDNRVLDWTPDGKDILFLPHRLGWSERMARPYVVAAVGGMERPLAIPEGGGGAYSPDGKKLVYTPIEREFRTWKRYQGGRAQDVWIYDLVANSSEQITDFRGTDNQPVWVGDTIYYTSDRTDTLELWAYDTKTKATRQVTHDSAYDVLWPSSGRSAVVYESGGFVYRFDPASGSAARVPIRLAGDFRDSLPRVVNVTATISQTGLSPSGTRALLGARGDVFSVPGKEGTIRNLTLTPGINEREPIWSPDGKWIAYLSDRTGEYELWVRPADGNGSERQVTHGAGPWRYTANWSPDSKRIAVANRAAQLQVIDVASGEATIVDKGRLEDLTDYHWSPDGRWIAYTKSGANRLTSLWLYSIGDKKVQQLTSGESQDFSPIFDPKGRYLYFLSNRDFRATNSGFEFEFVYSNPTRVYVGLLATDGPALFLPTSDEEKAATEAAKANGEDAAAKDDKADEAKKGKDGEEAAGSAPAAPPVKIDVAGFERRVRAIPGDPSDYRALGAVEKGVLYMTGTGTDTTLHLYDIEAKEEKTVLEGIAGYDLSADGKKLLWRKGNGAGASYGIVEAAADQKAAKALDLTRLVLRVDPRAEWAQEFVDCWRIMRDWFYDPQMHGLDWQAMRHKYEVLVPFMSHRTDLDFILGELGGELSAGHMYIGSNNEWQPPQSDNGLIGAEIEADPSGTFRIAKIYPGENWQEDFRSPLTEPGVKAKVGELILAVDGVPTKGVDNFYRLLENRANTVVTLRLAGSADGKDAHDERVRTITKETNLRYLDWVLTRRKLVDELSGGRVGYVHLPNTGPEGARELFKAFYPSSHKDAMIFDARYNGGGFIPFYMIQLLERPLLSYWARRDQEPFTTPQFFHRGPKVALANGYSSSGGDAFPYYFRQRGLGKLIGTRTWGGLIGISGNPGLMDGSTINVPTFRFIDATTGQWAVEAEGVAPDIEVIDRPELIAAGKDPSIEKAIEVLLEEMKKSPPQPLTVPPAPNRAPHAGGTAPTGAD